MFDNLVLPGIKKNYLQPDFWVNKVRDSKKVLLDVDGIDEFNTVNLNKVGEAERLYNIFDLGNFINGLEVQRIIKKMSFPCEDLYCCGNLLCEKRRKEILDNCNLTGIEQNVVIKYGITTSRGDIRIMPVFDNLNDTPDDVNTDILQSSALLINEPVAVLHESLDGKWFFIRCSYYEGWILKKYVGLVDDYHTIEEVITSNNFVVVTANKTIVSCKYNDIEKNMQLSMGSRFLISKCNNNCETGITINIPVRNENGMLEYTTTVIDANSVCLGYMEYTTKNVITQAFKTLGDIYGWGGMFNSRDCSSLVLDVYRCFGIHVPRDSANLAKLVNTTSYTRLNYMSVNERSQLLNQIRPGAILGWPGHTMLYLGCDNKKHYVINYVGHFSIIGEDNRKIRLQTDACLVNDLCVYRDNGISWLESLTYIKIP